MEAITVLIKQLFTSYAELRLKAIGTVIDAGMYDFAVATAGVLSKTGLLFQNHDLHLSCGWSRNELVGDGETDNTCPDYGNIESIQNNEPGMESLLNNLGLARGVCKPPPGPRR